MNKFKGNVIYSASDLVNFLECEHCVTLNMIDLNTPLQKAEEDEQNKLIQQKGYEHEESYLKRLKNSGFFISDLRSSCRDIESSVKSTIDAMKAGADIIYQPAFLSGRLSGHADFLRRIERPSNLGHYSYEVLDTKLSRTPKAKFLVQLCCYSDMLMEVQGVAPEMMHLVLGDGTEQNFRVANFFKYYRNLKKRFLEYVGNGINNSYPERCDHCDLCKWCDLCTEKWLEDDHLNQIANITRIQIKKLKASGITTLEQLAKLDEDRSIPKIAQETLIKIRSQAALQMKKRKTKKDYYEILPLDITNKKGFLRLPKPDNGDIFFDMEGDPLELDGLEYLFGVYYFDNNKPCFKDFWAHNKREEKTAFESFMDFVNQRLKKHPDMHIYHYAHYEETALKRLMSWHGTRESDVDNLLREGKLVDLYKVVRESIRVSEPSYSIKNLERFYMGQREGEVTSAGDSIVYYEKWRLTGDKSYLEKIRDYNEFDCRSTHLLREWLLSLRPDELPWFDKSSQDTGEDKDETRTKAEDHLTRYEKLLSGDLPDDHSVWTPEQHFRKLATYLIDFYRRADKPLWWTMFSRKEMTHEELVEDPECIGMLKLDTDRYPPVSIKRSMLYTYNYPEQEFKMKKGDGCYRSDTLQRLGTIEDINESERIIQIRISTKIKEAPDIVSIIPPGPINNDILRAAVRRFADSIIDNNEKYQAVKSILVRENPKIKGHNNSNKPIIANENRLIEESTEAIMKLKDSYLFIQGPPGAGKTYTGSHIIVELLRKGFKVGVSSNSHNAINNLLKAVEKCAHEKNFKFSGAKKSGNYDNCFNGSMIEDISNDAIFSDDYSIVAGTAWLFANEALDNKLDYLFIDEAGQVSLANLVAMGTSAKNIVLIGDQMQLGQPIQGVHPGRSGESILEFLLDGKATIEPHKGIFLGTTWRMHNDVCTFISEAVYDSRLYPQKDNQKRQLVLSNNPHPALKPTGIRFIKAEHDGCSQKSEEEAQMVKELYQSLLEQSYRDNKGNKKRISAENILVVAPYNMQVNLLKSVLPDDAKVGTIDKFQGQEAEIVIISMTTSSGEYLPRFMEFLYDKNRLNVAISRAKCLAILIANPALMSIKCNTIKQMELVNTLCWADEYAGRFN